MSVRSPIEPKPSWVVLSAATVNTPHQMSRAAVSSAQVGVAVSAFVLTASEASDQSLSVSPFLASTRAW